MTSTNFTRPLRVTASTYTVRLLNSRWFIGFRHGFPLFVLLIVYWLLGAPPFVIFEFLVLTAVVVGLSTSIIRYITLALLSRATKGKPEQTLLELKDGVLRLNLGDDIQETLSLSECERILVSRKRWWIAPHLAFTIKRRDGYSQRIETNVDLPELRQALITISDRLSTLQEEARGTSS